MNSSTPLMRRTRIRIETVKKVDTLTKRIEGEPDLAVVAKDTVSNDAEEACIIEDLKKQRRLLQLHHASLCPHDSLSTTTCQDLPHCVAVKRLFNHVVSCRRRGRCDVPGCWNMSFIWNHYQACREENCTICSAVRQTGAH